MTGILVPLEAVAYKHSTGTARRKDDHAPAPSVHSSQQKCIGFPGWKNTMHPPIVVFEMRLHATSIRNA